MQRRVYKVTRRSGGSRGRGDIDATPILSPSGRPVARPSSSQPTTTEFDDLIRQSEELSKQTREMLAGDTRSPLDDIRRGEENPARPHTPASEKKAASPTSSSTRPEIPFRPGDSSETSGRRKSKLGRNLIIGSSVISVLVSAVAFYFAITGTPRNVLEQVSRQTREFFMKQFSQSVKPYLIRYFAKYVFGNTVAINSCVGERGNIVTKDCFYRYRRDDYPRSFVGRAFQAWDDSRLASRVLGGIDITYEPDALLDSESGRRGARWIITMSDGEYSIDPSNPDAGTTAIFDDRRQAGHYLMTRIRETTHISRVLALKLRIHAERKWGILARCNFYCEGRRAIESGKDKLIDFRMYVLGNLVAKVMPRTGIFIGCMLSTRDYSCLESDSRFQQAFQDEVRELRLQEGGEGRLERLLKFADEAKMHNGRITALIFNKIVIKLAQKLAPSIAAQVANGVPIAGQIVSGVAAGWGVFSTGVLAYRVYRFLSTPMGKFALTTIMAMGFVGAYNLLSSCADERNGARPVYDPDADQACNEAMDKLEYSAVWQSQNGNVEGLKDFRALFGPRAYAAEVPPDVYPNRCNADGDARQPGSLVCENWKFDYVPPVIAAAQQAALPQDAGEFGDAIADFADEINGFIGAPFDAAAQAALETEIGRSSIEAASAALEPVIQPAINEVLTPPYDGPEDVKGAKLIDGAWAGATWSHHDMARGGTYEDGTVYGWGRLLKQEEAEGISRAAEEDSNKAFATLPLWKKIFSTEYKQSFASRFSQAAPTAINTPIEYIASILNPLTGMRFAALTNVAHAQITPMSNFFHIPYYGATLEEIDSAPLVDENNPDPCTNDRQYPEVGAPGTVDMGLGRAEITTFNSCLLAKTSLELFSGYDSAEPIDTTAANGRSTLATAGQPGVATGLFTWPIAEADYQGSTSCWGDTFNRGAPHGGIDLLGKMGDGKTEIIAADGGQVMTATNSSSAGGLVIIKHSPELYTMYMHMDPARLAVKAGDQVTRGQLLGYQSHYGDVSPPGPAGSHLHFTISKTGFNNYNETYNPLQYLPLTGEYKARTSCSV